MSHPHGSYIPAALILASIHSDTYWMFVVLKKLLDIKTEINLNGINFNP